MQVTPHWQSASPELVSCFNSNLLYNLDREDKHGAFEVAVFGGKNTKQNLAASIFLPYGHSSLTFDGSVSTRTFAQDIGESDIAALSGATLPTTYFELGLTSAASGITGSVNASGLTYITSDPVTYKFDKNKDTSKILPWNFGITFAALFEPRGASASGAFLGSGLVTNPTFKSTICPTWSYSHVGAGFALRYQFSDDKQGFFGVISTAVQNVKSNICLNEDEISPAQVMNTTNFPFVDTTIGQAAAASLTLPNPYGTTLTTGTNATVSTVSALTYGPNDFTTLLSVTAATTPTGSIYTAYYGTSFPAAFNTTTVAPANVAEAFAQDAWLYGKIPTCSQKITRLADIELSLGYQWYCGDCASTNWYVGLVIPTGNKPCATYIAPAVVGNGQHVGIMTGACTQLLLSDSADYMAWYRIDTNFRYLFRNTQKRSFDLLGNEWSRYMMVYANEDAYTDAVAALNALAVAGTGQAVRQYTPGINVFTTDFYIKPQFQGRVNQAVYFQAEHMRAELGWNVFVRQKDCVELACDWTALPAFADSSYLGGIALNNNRTIYNDSQTTAYNVVSTANRFNNGGATPTAVITAANEVLAATNYDDFAITESQISLDSVATPGAITNTPYLVLGYAFESDYKPQFSVGGSYEFTTSNRALNQWLVWGKFEFAF